MPKVTPGLRIDGDLGDWAGQPAYGLGQPEQYVAAAEGTSVSALFSRLLRAMTRASASREVVGPLTRKATGLVRLPETAGDEGLLEDALARKYAVRK